MYDWVNRLGKPYPSMSSTGQQKPQAICVYESGGLARIEVHESRRQLVGDWLSKAGFGVMHEDIVGERRILGFAKDTDFDAVQKRLDDFEEPETIASVSPLCRFPGRLKEGVHYIPVTITNRICDPHTFAAEDSPWPGWRGFRNPRALELASKPSQVVGVLIEWDSQDALDVDAARDAAAEIKLTMFPAFGYPRAYILVRGGEEDLQDWRIVDGYLDRSTWTENVGSSARPR